MSCKVLLILTKILENYACCQGCLLHESNASYCHALCNTGSKKHWIYAASSLGSMNNFQEFFMSMSSTLHATASGGQGHIAHSYFLRNWFLKMPQITPLDRILECYKQAWSRLKNLLKSKSKFIESKFSEPKLKSVFIESVFYVFVFDFGITSIISKNYDSIYFDTKFNRCYFNKYRIVSVL